VEGQGRQEGQGVDVRSAEHGMQARKQWERWRPKRTSMKLANNSVSISKKHILMSQRKEMVVGKIPEAGLREGKDASTPARAARSEPSHVLAVCEYARTTGEMAANGS
jgi:hypothetical protein